MALNHSDVMRHAGMAQFFKPWAGIGFHASQAVGGEQVTPGFDGFAFARGEEIFSFQSPKTKESDWHVCADSGFDGGGFFDVEMASDFWTGGGANGLA